MGSGGGNLGPYKIGGISGQGGGRIIPGTAGGVGEVFSQTSRLSPVVDTAYPDLRPVKPFGSTYDTVFAAPGGGPGQAGRGDTLTVYRDGAGSAGFITPLAGGGGGWGAAGGAGTHMTGDATNSYTVGGNLGAAGGKAIKTNGHLITWLGGSDRAYGAIG